MADCVHGVWQDRAQELAIARQALAEDDAPHAAHHAAGALALDPNDAEALKLVDTLIRWRPKPATFSFLTRMLRPGQPEKRAPAFGDHDWWGLHLVRGRAAELDGALNEAFDVIVQVAAVAVHVDLSPWTDRILDAAEARGERISARPFFTAFGQLSRGTIGLLRLRPAEQAAFSRWADLGLRLERHVKPELMGVLTMTAAGFLRRAGRFDEAVALADRGLAGAGDEQTRENLRVQRGLALRGAGRWDEAIETFPVDLATEPVHQAEIARTLVDAGRREQAIAALRKCSPEDDELQVQLGLLEGADDPRTRSAAELLDGAPVTCDDVRRLFLGHTWPHLVPNDASTNILLQEEVPGGPFSCAVSVHESGSVRMTLALHTCGRPDPREVDYSGEALPTPDPAEPLDPAVAVRLWERDPEGVLVQAVPPPSEATAAAVRALASRMLASDRAALAARTLAEGLDPDDVVRALVHPEPAPEGVRAPPWVSRWQCAAAHLLGAADPGVPWVRSRRRTLLRSVLFSNPDWTTAAALLALLEVALDDPAAAPEIREWVTLLSREAPDQGHCCWAAALERVARVLPDLPPNLLEPVKPWLA